MGWKRKPHLCRPCQEETHRGCDGPKVCECTLCAQMRELEDTAAEEDELQFPLDRPDSAY
jgi:hypothetical protein